MKIRAVYNLILGFGLVFSPVAAPGQAVYGSIVGTVTDPAGAAVPSATVTIRDAGKGVSFTESTNSNGNYSRQHLIAGDYEVRVEAPGFAPFVQKNVRVEVDAAAQVNVQLSIGAVGVTVNVSADTPVLKTTRADVSDTITQRAAADLPVLQRDISRMYFLVPGVQVNGTTAASEQPQDVYRPNIAGQYWGGIGFQLDGTDNRDAVLGEPVISPNLDSLAEMKISTAAYDAEFGQASQAVVSAQTRSGTNDLHGGLFWYRRDANSAARDPFAQAQPIAGSTTRFIPPTLWNQFGGSFGGPIQRNKTFFFGDYQGSRQKNGGSLLTRVPTQAERNGDLSDLLSAGAIFNPCDGSNCNVAPAARQQFSNNIISPSLLSPQAQALLAYLPLPNIAGVTGAAPNYAASGTAVVHSDSTNGRIDRYQTDKLHLFGRYTFYRTDQAAPGAFGEEAGGPNFSTAGFAGTSSLRNQSVAYGMDYTISPTWLSDFRFGFFRYRVFVNPNGLGSSPAKDAGIPGLNLDSYYTSGMPNFYVNGTGGFSMGYALNNDNNCNCPLNEQENNFQWVGNTTRIVGNHSIKMGVDFRYAQNLRVPSDSHRSGILTFNAVTTSGPNGGGLPLASFLLGDVSSFNRYVSDSTTAAERQHRLFSYAQDTWRITPKLTLNYGLRWEIYFPQYVNGANQGATVSLSTGEVAIAGQNGVNDSLNVKTALTHIAPRTGIAYQVTAKTVIRAGYGRSYDSGVFGTSFGHNVTQNVPVLANQSVTPASAYLPVFTLAQGPPALDPVNILATQPKGPHGNPILPNNITPNVLPLTAAGTMRLPTVDAFNATVERQLSSSMIVSVGFVGNKGTHVFTNGGNQNYNINEPAITGFGALNTNQRRLFYNEFGWSQAVQYFADDSSNHFDSLQVRFDKRLSQGLLVQANFTWASAFDFANDYYFWNPAIDYGREASVRRFVWNMNHVYELPFGKNQRFLKNPSRTADLLAGGWQLSGIWVWESGVPFTPSYSSFSNDADTGPNRPNLVGNPIPANQTAAEWFIPAPAGTSGSGCAPSATATPLLNANGCTRGPWQRPAAGTFGNATRSGFFGPHAFNADISLGKTFRLSERLSGQFRADLFNAFNHANLGLPNTTVDSPTGGQITSLAPLFGMRKWQLGLRVNF